MTLALPHAGVGGNGVCLRYFGTAEWGCVGAKKVQPFAAGLSAGHSSKGPGRSGKERQDFYLGLVQMAAYLKARPPACSVIWCHSTDVCGRIAEVAPSISLSWDGPACAGYLLLAGALLAGACAEGWYQGLLHMLKMCIMPSLSIQHHCTTTALDETGQSHHPMQSHTQMLCRLANCLTAWRWTTTTTPSQTMRRTSLSSLSARSSSPSQSALSRVPFPPCCLFLCGLLT